MKQLPLLVRLLVLSLLISAFPFNAHAQDWSYSTLPGGQYLDISSSTRNPGHTLLLTPYSILLSTDDGSTWDTVQSFDDEIVEHGAFSRHATLGDTILLGFTSSNGQYLLFSYDNGSTWENRQLRPDVFSHNLHTYVRKVNSECRILLTEHGRYFYSCDLGVSWAEIESPELSDIQNLILHPSDANCLYALSRHYASFDYQLQYSSDFGQAWERLDDPAENTYRLLGELFIDAAEPTIMLASGMEGQNGPYEWIRSTDGGIHWAPVDLPDVSFYGEDIQVLPAGGIALVSTTGILVTWNGGLTWEDLWSTNPNSFYQIYGKPNLFRPAQSGASCDFIVFGSTLLKSEDNGQTWTDDAFNLQQGYCRNITAHPTLDGTIFAYGLLVQGAGNIGLIRSTDNGSSWERLSFQRITRYHIDPLTPNVHLTVSEFPAQPVPGAPILDLPPAISISFDDGATWTGVDDNLYEGPDPSQMVIDAVCIPGYPDTLFAVVDYNHLSLARLQRTLDGGETWTGIPGVSPRKIYVDPTQPERIYCINVPQREFLRSDDLGETFIALSYPEQEHMNYFVVQPGTGYLFASNEDKLWISEDHGESFYQITDAPLEIKALVFDPSSDTGLLVSTPDYLYYMPSLEDAWIRQPHVPDMGRNPSRIALGGDGSIYIPRDEWGLQIGDAWLVTGVDQEVRTSQPTELNLSAPYPNPFNGQTRITFTIPRSGQVTLQVFDLLGREVTHLDQPNLTAGQHSYTWNTSSLGLASGTYIVRMTQGDQQVATRAVLVK